MLTSSGKKRSNSNPDISHDSNFRRIQPFHSIGTSTVQLHNGLFEVSFLFGSMCDTAALASLSLQKGEEDGVAIDEEHNRSSHAKKN